MRYLQADKFLEKSEDFPIIDVRSPIEFEEGHIPGALNIPLFNNEERKIIGTLYKKQGRDHAILEALKLTGPNLANKIIHLQKFTTSKEILLHCWRGGLRSKNMAWLFEMAGYNVFILERGYKAYRKYIREKWAEVRNYKILGGKTGSGKSEILHVLKKEGFQIFDLEKIANHKGSAFGNLGLEPQPTNEQFENNLYKEWAKLDPDEIIWVEDESRGIGKVSLPKDLYDHIRNACVYFIDVPKSCRINRLVDEYANFPHDNLICGINRISKRLGGLNTKLATEAILKNDYKTATDILLIYYDKAYLKGLAVRDQKKVLRIESETEDAESNTKLLLKSALHHKPY